MSDTASGSASAAPDVVGSTVPRLWTPPLVTGPAGPCGCGCALTDETSMGFAVVEWAWDVLHVEPYPWQRWLLIHGMELLPDGRPRFRTLLIEVARQNGKTFLLTLLALWWQFVVEVPLILGTSTKLDYAKESWHASVNLAEAATALTMQRGRRWTREANGEQESWTVRKSRYKIAPASVKGGRSLTVHRLILDELREHYDYSAWAASTKAGSAVKNFQAWAITNAGSDRSVVLNDLHDACETFITTGVGDRRSGMFSWSCTEDMDPTDPAALALANPSMNNARTGEPSTEVLLGDASLAIAAGSAALAVFQTETMCIRVRSMNGAIDLGAWGRCAVPASLDGFRDRVAACLDVSPDGQRGDLVVAAIMPDGKVRLEHVRSWDSLSTLRSELPAWLTRVRPYTFGWFPGSGAAALLAEFAQVKGGRVGWPPRGVRVAEIKGETPAVCMSFAAWVTEEQTVHSGQDSLDTQMGNAEKRARGDALWVFDRREGGGHVTSVYAAAGAAHLARTIPVPVRRAGLHVAR
jgi:hypothetical protein